MYVYYSYWTDWQHILLNLLIITTFSFDPTIFTVFTKLFSTGKFYNFEIVELEITYVLVTYETKTWRSQGLLIELNTWLVWVNVLTEYFLLRDGILDLLKALFLGLSSTHCMY